MEKKNIHNLLEKYNLVVPEIQREYVWGNNKTVVETFMRDLIDSVKKGEANVGFLYSYKSGAEYHIIDGQQRITTIILLLYVLAAENKDVHQEFIELLRINDTMPAFEYRVRATTVSFMKNLFNSRLTDVNDIVNQIWFKRAYNNDVTIKALLETITIFNNMSVSANLDYHEVIENITFWYFAVEQTSQGEELYITMNSRGEKLSDNEQLKPRLFSKLKNASEKERYGKLWDDWEEYFYSHRNDRVKKSRDIKSVDVAMNNVIRIVLELKTKGEHNEVKVGKDEKNIDLVVLEQYMDAIKYLLSLNKSYISEEIDKLYGDANSDQNFFVLKALLIERIKGQEDILEFERVFHTMKNQVRRNKIKSHKGYLSFLDNYRVSSKEFYDFAIEDAKIINGHELDKVIICNQQGEETERALWSVQEENFWNGNIRPLISWASKDGLFMLSDFRLLHANFVKFFNEGKEKDCTNDLVIRALLCLELTNYPLKGTNFGYTREEWMDVFTQNEDRIKDFLIGIGTSESIEDYCAEFISKHDPKKDWAEFVEEPELLEYLNTKHIYPNKKFGLLLVKNSWAQPLPVKVMHAYQVLRKECNDILCTEQDAVKWHLWYYTKWEHPCAVIDNKLFAIDILYIQEEDKANHPKYRIELFKRGDNTDTESELKSTAEPLGFIYEQESRRYVKEIDFNDQSLWEQIKSIYENVEVL